MGNSVSSAGDVDGDGYADLIVGAHAFANGEDDEGVAFVFLGSAEGITGAGPADSHSQLEANQGGARMGTSVAASGDVHGDGYTAVVVGAQS